MGDRCRIVTTRIRKEEYDQKYTEKEYIYISQAIRKLLLKGLKKKILKER